ncbi:uncharacterized mitochondrial protein AtMg00310-like [Tripterygium wilfordii]|uniref:uncharacterized mitochondrial protein AtMg00310-like n=1 Tax=Tripterygium wilfordii TaxID=458696 RepID=UPI0018F857AA|nr:uncharacterized mitochondrial protein AtMg00310-like [Tripterygium wilfordii]
MWNKVQGWWNKNLSRAGKEIHVKAVIQAIPTHMMNCMRIPKVISEEFNRIIRKFWWGNADKHSIHWIGWDEMCSAKGDGGLGFKDLDLFNLAYLPNRDGDCYKIHHFLVRESLKGNIILQGLL